MVASAEDAVVALRAGLVVAVPTDTVYGLAVDAALVDAAGVLGRAKGRPSEVPVQVLVSGIEQALSFGGVVRRMRCASRAASGRERSPSWCRGGRGWSCNSVATGPRSGSDGPLTTLSSSSAARCGPLAATSANRHGEPPLDTAAEVATAFSDEVAVVLDGGRCPGIASTVVDLTGDSPRLLREGAVSEAVISEAFSGRSA